MDIISIVLTIALLGFLLWVIETLIPMPPKFKMVLRAFIGVLLCLWVLQQFGYGPNLRLR